MCVSVQCVRVCSQYRSKTSEPKAFKVSVRNDLQEKRFLDQKVRVTQSVLKANERPPRVCTFVECPPSINCRPTNCQNLELLSHTLFQKVKSLFFCAQSHHHITFLHAYVSVILSVCLSARKTKTAESTITKLASGIVRHESSLTN